MNNFTCGKRYDHEFASKSDFSSSLLTTSSSPSQHLRIFPCNNLADASQF